MKTNVYIFKEKLANYLILCIFLCPITALWIGHYAFPFGNSGAIGLFILILYILLMWAIVLWKSIKHKKQLIIDSTGIHYQNRRFTLSHNSKFWLDEYTSYPWDTINDFTFEWIPPVRGIGALLNLVVEENQKQPTLICVAELTGNKQKYIHAIEECSRGKCKFNIEKYNLNKKERNKMIWDQIKPLLIFGIVFTLFLIYVAKQSHR